VAQLRSTVRAVRRVCQAGVAAKLPVCATEVSRWSRSAWRGCQLVTWGRANRRPAPLDETFVKILRRGL